MKLFYSRERFSFFIRTYVSLRLSIIPQLKDFANLACVLLKTIYNSLMKQLLEEKFSIPWLLKGLVFFLVALIFIGWIYYSPPGLLGKADAIGYAVCHRIDARTFHLGDRQLPLCARCSGMFLGALIGLVYQTATRPRRAGMPHWSVMIVLFILAGSFALDGLNSYIQLFPGAPSLYETQNWSRLLTGSGMGLAISGLLFPAFNQTVWEKWYATPAIKNLGSMIILLVLTLFFDIMILSENPFILYPLAILSSLSVILLLTLVYTMVLLMVFRKENYFQNITQLVFPLVGGFGVALLQIILLDLVRYLFTGTWEGFKIG